jgi:hypothetical protein
MSQFGEDITGVPIFNRRSSRAVTAIPAPAPKETIAGFRPGTV